MNMQQLMMQAQKMQRELKKAQDALKAMKDNEKNNEIIVQKLKDNNAYSATNFEKLKLLENLIQICIY